MTPFSGKTEGDARKKTVSANGMQLNKDFCASTKPALKIDIEKYQAMLDEPGLSEAQKKKLLEALWSIVIGFVELGFDVHPLQDVCGKDHQSNEKLEFDAFDDVK